MQGVQVRSLIGETKIPYAMWPKKKKKLKEEVGKSDYIHISQIYFILWKDGCWFWLDFTKVREKKNKA